MGERKIKRVVPGIELWAEYLPSKAGQLISKHTLCGHPYK